MLFIAFYILAGLITALRCVPWDARQYYVGRCRSTAGPARYLGGSLVAGLVVTFWPLYLYCYLRPIPPTVVELQIEDLIEQ